MAPPPFDYQALWNKALLFINRALDPSIDFDEQGMWAANALELLGKAALAKRHPSLIADPLVGGGKSTMLTAGVGGDDWSDFVSIGAKTVYERCGVIAPGFNIADAVKIAGNRNAYVHAGGPLCSTLNPEAWWRRYWPLVGVLLAAQDRALEDFVGTDNLAAVETSITNAQKHTAALVAVKVARAKDIAARSDARSLTATALAEVAKRTSAVSMLYTEFERCPACNEVGEVGSDYELTVVEHTDGGMDQDGDWFPGETRYEVLAESFVCKKCGLVLQSPEEITAAGVSETFEVIETDDDDFYGEPDYGND